MTTRNETSVRTYLASVDAVHNLPAMPVEDQKMPVDHPLNCRCKECRE